MLGKSFGCKSVCDIALGSDLVQCMTSYWLFGCFDIRIPVTKLTVKLGLAAVCAYIGALLAFPGLRLAQTHLDAVQMNSDRPLIQ